MRKLLRFNFHKLFRMKTFYLGIAVMIFYAAMSNISRFFEMQEGYLRFFEESLWVFGILFMFVAPVIVHLFITPDYSDGTIRNKLIIGYNKSRIFLANLITMLFVTVVFFITYNACYYAIGLPLFITENPLKYDILFCFEELIACLALTSILVLAAMFISSKITAGILCFCLSMSILFSGLWIKTRLSQPELVNDNVFLYGTFDGETIHEEERLIPNPKYVPEGPARELLKNMERTNVGAQLIDIGDIHEVGFIWYILYDNALMLLIALGGSTLYKRKDLT